MSESSSGSTRMWEELEPLVAGHIPDAVGEYLREQPYRHQERLADAFAQLRERSTPAFRHNVDAALGNGMPVSFQETNYVCHALAQYGQQRTPWRHRVAGYLNWPSNQSPNVARHTRAQLDRFIEANPHIPFGYFEAAEPAPITIGGIRKLVTDATMALCDESALLSSPDADQRWLNSTYLDDLITAYCQAEHTPAAVLPTLTHSRVTYLPRIDHTIRWFEDVDLNRLHDCYFEPGPAFGAPQYRKAGGYDPYTTLAETHQLINAIERLSPDQSMQKIWIPQARMVLSPRRIIQKLAHGHPLEGMWSWDEDFGATHPYRNGHDNFHHLPDLTPERHDDCLREYGRTLVPSIARVAIARGLVSNSTSYALNELEKVRQRLGGPDDMFAVSETLS